MKNEKTADELIDGAKAKLEKKRAAKQPTAAASGQAPSVGRIVHYVKNGGEEFEIMPAIIMSIRPSGAVNLNVMEPGFITYMRDIPECKTPQAGFWMWPSKV